MHNVQQIAEYLGVTDKAVYNKFKTHRTALESHIVKQNGKKHVDEEGLKILMATMGNNNNPTHREVNQSIQTNNDFFDNLKNEYKEIYEMLIQSLRQDKEYLQEELKKRDIIITQQQEKINALQEEHKAYLLTTAENSKTFLQRLFNK